MIALGLGCLWLIGANVAAMVPSRDNHWARAIALIVLGVPLLGYITYSNGPLLGMMFLLAGASVLRWPLVHLARRVRRLFPRADA